MFCFCITSTALLAAFSVGNLLYCQNCSDATVRVDNYQWPPSDCTRCPSVDQFHKEILRFVPDLRGVARVLHLEALERFAGLFKDLHPATFELISVMSVFLLASLTLSAT